MPRRDDHLEPIAPEDAVEMYLESKASDDIADSTDYNYRGRLETFLQFCEEEDITNINDLSGRDFHNYKNKRSNGNLEGYEPIKKVSLNSNMKTLQDFLRFCYEIDAAPKGMHQKVPVPTLSDEEAVRSEMLAPDRAREILSYLEKHRYASRTHVAFMILWHTGRRIGGLRALDVDDFDGDDGYLHFQHRPETDTPLKNDEKSERYVAVGEYEAEVIEDWIKIHRPSVTDDYGRRPLISTTQGRAAAGTIRTDIYRITQPCEYTGECPHDKNPTSCDWRERDHLAKCPSSRSPHRLRDGRLTKHRMDGDPRDVVSERTDASEEIIDKHYDQRSEYQKMQTRRDYLDNV
jgi:integrase